MIIESMESNRKTNTHRVLEVMARRFGRAPCRGRCCQLRANRMKQNADRTPNISRSVREGREVVMAHAIIIVNGVYYGRSRHGLAYFDTGIWLKNVATIPPVSQII